MINIAYYVVAENGAKLETDKKYFTGRMRKGRPILSILKFAKEYATVILACTDVSAITVTEELNHGRLKKRYKVGGVNLVPPKCRVCGRPNSPTGERKICDQCLSQIGYKTRRRFQEESNFKYEGEWMACSIDLKRCWDCYDKKILCPKIQRLFSKVGKDVSYSCAK